MSSSANHPSPSNAAHAGHARNIAADNPVDNSLVRMRTLLDRALSPSEIESNTALVAAPLESRTGAVRSILVFTVGGERLAVEARGAHRVVELSSVRRIPHRINEVFAGIANIGGELTLVARIDAALGFQSTAPATQFVVVGEPSNRWAFAVEHIEGVRRIEDARMLAPPTTLRHAFDGCTVALIELDAATSDVGASGNPTLVSILDESRLATLFARSLV